MIRLIASDIDGTLLQGDESTLRPALFGEIRRLLLAQEGDTAGPLLRGLAEKPAGELEALLHSLREAAGQGGKSGRPA